MLNNMMMKLMNKWVVFGGTVVLGLAAAAYGLLFLQPTVVSPDGASLGVTQVGTSTPVVIVLDHPVNKKTLTYEIHPELAGSWKLTSNPFTPTSRLEFTPTEPLQLDTRYTIELSGIKSILGSRQEDYLLSFQTDTAPVIQSVSPAEAVIDVLPDAPVILTLDKPLSDGVAVTASLTPEIVLGQPEISGNTVTFNHTEPFLKSTAYTLNVSLSTGASDETPDTKTLSFTTIAAPGIQAYSPSGSDVDPATTIQVEFQQPMEKESTQSAFSLSPETPGTFTWENDQKLIFTPAQALAKEQPYMVMLATTAKAASGVATTEKFSFPFTTLGAAAISSITPRSGATNVDTGTTVSIAFNQDVVQASAESKFSMAPAVEGSFTWSGKTMIFRPRSALANSKAYTVTVAKGVQSVKGRDSTSDFSAKFTTRSKSVMLSVPAYAQAHNYSCMIAAARSALAFRGVKVSEADIISRVGKDTTRWSGTWAKDGAVWGDPDVAIIGDLDGRTNDIGWGYGSHWAPIAKALTSYGVANEVRTAMTTQDLAQALSEGKPVIVWWVNGVWPAYEVRWKTKTGKQVRGVNSLHVQVVRGFSGTVENPVSFTVTDSGYGYPGRTIDVGTFKAKWKWFTNTGIIVK